MKYLLIDGNNLAIRAAFANSALATTTGIPTGAHFGFFNSIFLLKDKFIGYKFLIVWDSSSQRRKKESNEAVELNIIPEPYKENRRKGETPQPLADWFAQGDFLKRALDTVGIPQIKIDGYEADDVIASYCNILKKDNSIVIVTSDQDYYQLLDDNVVVYDGMRDKIFNKQTFKDEFGIEPYQHVHVGALMGDKGDHIFGIPGWGDKTALSAIQDFGTYQKVIENLENMYKNLIQDFDISVDPDFFTNNIINKKNDKGKLVYPEVYVNQPYSSLLVKLDSGEIKIPKKDLMAMMFKDRVKLAFSLKKMDDKIENLPDIEEYSPNRDKFIEYASYYEMYSLINKFDQVYE